MQILLVANAVGPLGDGIAGGVSDVLSATAGELCRRGHKIDILAGEASRYDGSAHLIRIPGSLQPTLMNSAHAYDAYPIVASSLIANYWDYIRTHQHTYDVVINFCQDWLPFYLTPFMDVPVLHQVSLCDQNTVVTEQIHHIARRYHHRIAVLSMAQARALDIEDDAFLCRYGIDASRYRYSGTPQPGHLVWCARISPEKGLEDAAEIARRCGKRLLVCGYMEDATYFEQIMAVYGDIISYQGFLDKVSMAEQIGRAEALLCTHKCIEAFGVVVLEALACGTPVITYNRGGPAEIIRHGNTGFIVDADDIDKAVSAVKDISRIHREACRKECQSRFRLSVYGDSIESWIEKNCGAFLQLVG